MDEAKTEAIFIRCLPEAKACFAARAKRNGRTVSDVLRELITAWGEGRVTVTPHE